jgi:hypothetical protein
LPVAAAGATAPAGATPPVPAGAGRALAIAIFSAVGATPGRPAGAVSVADSSGRISWREVVNWCELHAAARR